MPEELQTYIYQFLFKNSTCFFCGNTIVNGFFDPVEASHSCKICADEIMFQRGGIHFLQNKLYIDFMPLK